MRTTLAALLLALPLAAGAATPSDPLAFVPPGATCVGMVRLADIRTTPWAASLFNEADHVTLDGDGGRFLAEAHLKPAEDLDTIVFAAVAGQDGEHGTGLAILEGRFDAESVTAALLARGATKSGRLLILPEKGERGDGTPGVLAFLDRHLAVAGPQALVEAALAQASARSDFRTGAGLGRHLRRVPSDASAWILVDTSRQPEAQRAAHASERHHGEHGDSGSAQLVQIAGMMKQVPVLAMSATLKRDGMRLAAFGACDDAETRGLLEDSLRGILAAWRLAVQDAKPELVSVLRTFRVEQGKDGVWLSGTVPGAQLESFLAKKGH